MKTSVIALLALVASSAQGSNLRSNANQPQDMEKRRARVLQVITTTVLNSLIETFTPFLEDTVQMLLQEDFEPLDIGNQTEIDLQISGGGICRTSASITYGLGSVEGLSTMKINQLELQPGTESIDVNGFLGTDGASWSGVWLGNATFGNVTAETTATFQGSSCGMEMEQTITGTATLVNPSMEILVKMAGDTENIIMFTSSSQLTEVELQNATFHFDAIDANLGSFGNFIQFDIGNSFDSFMVKEFSEFVEPFLIETINSELADEMPYKFD